MRKLIGDFWLWSFFSAYLVDLMKLI